MAKIDLVSNEWTDLVFEGRNQSYGAYVLRKGTSKRNIYAMLAVLLLAVVGLLGIKLINFIQEQQAVANTQEMELSMIQEAKKAKKVEKVEQPKIEPEKVVEKVKSSIKFTAPVIKKDNEVKEEDEIDLKKVEDSKEAVGAFTVEGNDEVGGEVLKAKEEIAPPPEPEKPVEDNKVFDVVEQKPMFPGGDAALMQWLSSNIKYPVIAAENGCSMRLKHCFSLIERRSHGNAQCLGFLRARNDATVVVAQHHDGPLAQIGTEHPLARAIEIVAVSYAEVLHVSRMLLLPR